MGELQLFISTFYLKCQYDTLEYLSNHVFLKYLLSDDSKIVYDGKINNIILRPLSIVLINGEKVNNFLKLLLS